MMIKIGVIGAGNIANHFCQAVKESQLQAKLWAVASRDIRKAHRFQERYAIHKAYGSYLDLYRDPDIDLVYIAIPHAFHFQEMIKALDYNKHILCEKPFTLNAKQAQQIFTIAREKECFVMEALWTRFLPAIQEIKHEIDQGTIGDITKLYASFCFKAENPMPERLYKAELGGGALLDVGIYPINIANFFLGRPERMTSKVRFLKTGVDGWETIHYHYKKAMAILKSSINDSKDITGRIEGERGYIVLDSLHDCRTAHIYNHHDQLIKDIDIPFLVNGFEYEIEACISCIQNHLIESPVMPHHETLAILKQMDTLRASWNFQYPQEKITREDKQ